MAVATARTDAPTHGFLAMLVTLALRVADGDLSLGEARRRFADAIDAKIAQLRRRRMSQTVTVKTLGKGLVTVGLVVVVLNEVFTINAINNSSGPFAGLITTVENIGTSALTLAVIGFLILGGSMAMNFMDRF